MHDAETVSKLTNELISLMMISISQRNAHCVKRQKVAPETYRCSDAMSKCVKHSEIATQSQGIKGLTDEAEPKKWNNEHV